MSRMDFIAVCKSAREYYIPIKYKDQNSLHCGLMTKKGEKKLAQNMLQSQKLVKFEMLFLQHRKKPEAIFL